MENSQSELKAGIVIIISLTMLAALVIAVGKFESLWVDTALVDVEFKNIWGLKKDDPVFYAGVPIGRVREIKVVYSKDVKHTARVQVTLEIESTYRMRTGSTAYVDKTITGQTSVQITPGTGEPMAMAAGKRVKIEAEDLPSLMDLSKRATDLLDKAGQTIDSINADVIGAKQIEDWKQILTDVRKAAEQANTMMGTANEILNENRENFRTSIANIKSITANVDKLVTKNENRVDEALESTQRATKNLSEFSSKLNTGLYEDAQKILSTLSAIVEENKEVLRQAMANVRDVTANMKLMSADLREHPWKLLNPTEKDVRSDNLATAAKNVENAGKFIETSAIRLATVAEKPSPASPGVADQIKKLADELKAALGNLQTTQDQLKKVVEGKDAK